MNARATRCQLRGDRTCRRIGDRDATAGFGQAESGGSLDSRALHADSRQTDICSYLSAILLLGLGANALFGWWWADPAAGLLMVPISARRVLSMRGESCTCHSE